MLRFYPDDAAAAARIAAIAARYPARSLSPAQVQQTLIAADSLDEVEAAMDAAFAQAASATQAAHAAHAAHAAQAAPAARPAAAAA